MAVARRLNQPGLYTGTVMHQRLLPFRHGFTYRVFSLWLDLDYLPRLRFLSHNRFNLFGFYDRDHGARDGSAIKPWVVQHLSAAGLVAAEWRIRLLCYPRVLGYVFNPLSIYYCYDETEALRAILYEVKNTFGDQHGYLIPVAAETNPIEQACHKGLYVSPFIGPEATYHFRLSLPGDSLAVHIRQETPEGKLLIATHNATYKPLSDGALLRAFFTHPLMTMKVIFAIHWQALKLWRKGAIFHRRPEPPALPVTYVRQDQPEAPPHVDDRARLPEPTP